MKRMIALLFAIVMCATSFVSCDRSTESEVTDNSSNQSENAVPENAINIGESLLKLGVGTYSHDLRSSAIKEYREKYLPMTFDAFNKVENVYISADFEIASCNVSLISPVDDFNKDFEYNGYIDIALQTVISEKTVTIPVGWWYRAEDWTSEYHIWSYMLKVTDKDGNDHWYYFRINYDKYANYKMIKAENVKDGSLLFIVKKQSDELREIFNTHEWNEETSAISVEYNYVLYDCDKKINYCSSLGIFERDGKYLVLNSEERESMSRWFLTENSNVDGAVISSGRYSCVTIDTFLSGEMYDKESGSISSASGDGSLSLIYGYVTRGTIPGIVFDGTLLGTLNGEKNIKIAIDNNNSGGYDFSLDYNNPEQIKLLPKGQYYCIIMEYRNDEYIEELGRYVRSSWEHVCVLEIN